MGFAVAIDMNISLSALAGVVIGSSLSYFINKKLKADEKKEKQHSLAYVHFIQLTEIAALYMIVKDVAAKGLGQIELPEVNGRYELSHAASVVVADMFAQMNASGGAQVMLKNLMPIIDTAVGSLDRVVLSSQQIAELPKEAVYFYGRYVRFAKQLKAGLGVLKSCVENGEPDVVDGKFVYGLWMSTRNYYDAVEVLREAMRQHGGISNDYSAKALARQHDVLRVEVAEAMGSAPMIDEALKEYEASKADVS